MISFLLLCRFTGLFLKHQFELKTCWVVSLIAVQSTGLSGWAAYDPPQKTLETRFLIPKKCQQHCCCRCLESVFSKFAIFGVPPPWTGVSSSRSAKQQTNLPKNAWKSLPITSWRPDLKLVGISTKSMNSHFGAQKRSNSHIDEFHGSPGEIAKKILKYSQVFCMFFGIEQFFA